MPDVRNRRPWINLRNLSPETRDDIVKAARVRGYSYGEYVTKLVKLHQLCRNKADRWDNQMQDELKTLGLETVRES